MANQTVRPIRLARKLVAAVLGTVAVFDVMFGLGLSSWPIVALGAALLPLAIALGMINVARRGARAWAAGTAEVKSISPPPSWSSAVYGRAEIQVVIVAPGLPTSEVTIRDPRVPVAKWPIAGDTLPITVDVDDMRRVRINWDEAGGRPTGEDPPPSATDTADYGDPDDLLDDDLLGEVGTPPWKARPEDWDRPRESYDESPEAVRDTPDGRIVEGELVDQDDELPPLPRRAAATPRSEAAPPPGADDDFAHRFDDEVLVDGEPPPWATRDKVVEAPSSAQRETHIADPPTQRKRLLVAQAPAQVPEGHDLSVVVRIVAEGRPVAAEAAMSPPWNLTVPQGGTPVTVAVHAPRGLQVHGPLQQTVRIMPDDDPEPVRFGFRAHHSGLHRVDVTAWSGGTFLAEVSVDVSVAHNVAFRDAPAKEAPLDDARARPGEVTMEVRFDGTRYTFQIRSDAALFAPVVESVTHQPGAAVEAAIKQMQLLAAGRNRYSPAMTRQLIRQVGIQLWSEMVPETVREQFSEVVSHMTAFTIATDYDVIPWEILYPLNADRDSGFLVEQVPVVRRTYGQHRARTVSLGNPRFVVPPKAPTGAHAEIDAIQAILGCPATTPITTAEELLSLISSGAMGATHFACHNTFAPTGSHIDMDGGPFELTLMAEAKVRRLLAATSPLVFINACRSAGAAPQYTKMLGWAQQFMAAGAGAFVGTLWAVRTDSSASFATAFYEALSGGATLGAAALAARIAQQNDPLDPTWLAYTVYGDPFAIAR